MAGVSTPALAAAVSQAGGLGSIATAMLSVATVRQQLADIRRLTSQPFNVNLFCHQPVPADPRRDAAWLHYLWPFFAELGTAPPAILTEPFGSFLTDDALLELLLAEQPAAVSFHFGLPRPAQLAALRQSGATLLACVTSAAEGRAAEEAGIDVLVAQGIEAGGHRGTFDPAGPDAGLTTHALTRVLVRQSRLPIIAAGGLMTGADIATMLDAGAVAAQLGTAFIACPESAADEQYRAALRQANSTTAITRVLSGRPARCLVNHFVREADRPGHPAVAPYPWAYAASRALGAAARLGNQEASFAAHWAGSGVGGSRALPATELVRVLMRELDAAHAA